MKNESKYLSFILRHKPETIGLQLDKNGWASIDELISKVPNYKLTRSMIDIIVETNDKQRFAICDGKIRANQGHSLKIDLDLPEVKPPPYLLHGTAERFIASINENGLIKGSRHHVHLTETKTVAVSVGSRYGKSVVLKIDTGKLYKQGFVFYKTANNVWLVDSVPIDAIEVLYGDIE